MIMMNPPINSRHTSDAGKSLKVWALLYFHLRSSPLSNQNWVRHNIHLELSADSSTGATSHSAAATSFPSVVAKVKLNLINDHEMAMVDIAEVPGQLERRTEEQSYIRPWTAAFHNALHRGLLTDPGWLRTLWHWAGSWWFEETQRHQAAVISVIMPPPLDEKGGIITEKVFPVFSERVFRACFVLVI